MIRSWQTRTSQLYIQTPAPGLSAGNKVSRGKSGDLPEQRKHHARTVDKDVPGGMEDEVTTVSSTRRNISGLTTVRSLCLLVSRLQQQELVVQQVTRNSRIDN